MWVFYAFCSAFFAGITAVLTKIGLKDMNSNLATALRTVVVLIFSWLMVFICGAQNQIENLTVRAVVFLTLSGAATGASWLCYFRALQIGSINKVAPIDKSSTILTMLLAFVFFDDKITPVKVVSIVLIGIGTYMMIEKRQIDSERDIKSNWLLWAVLSAVFAALTSILGKMGVSEIDSSLGTAIRTVVVLIMSWLVVFLTKADINIKNTSFKSIVFLLLSGIATGASWLAYYKALKDGLASVVVPVDKLSILITVLFSRIVLKERLSKKSAVGLILIVFGTLLLLVK